MNSRQNSYHRSKLQITQVHSNLKQEVVEITVDRLKLILKDHIQAVEKQSSWKADLGIGLSLLLAVITSTFKSTWGVEGQVWRSLFIIGAILSGVRVAVSLIRYFKANNGIDALVDKIKVGTDTKT